MELHWAVILTLECAGLVSLGFLWGYQRGRRKQAVQTILEAFDELSVWIACDKERTVQFLNWIQRKEDLKKYLNERKLVYGEFRFETEQEFWRRVHTSKEAS